MKVTWSRKDGLAFIKNMDAKLLHLDWPPRFVWGRWLPNKQQPVCRLYQVGVVALRHSPLPQVLAARMLLAKARDRAKLDALPDSRKLRRRLRGKKGKNRGKRG